MSKYSLLLLLSLVFSGFAQEPIYLPSENRLPMQEWRAFVAADLIFWTARLDGCGSSAGNWTNALFEEPKKGSINDPNFGLAPGFKASFGIECPHDAWEILAKGTFFHSGERHSSWKSAPLRSGAGPLWFMGEEVIGSLSTPDFPLLISAKSRWDLHFQVVDLLLARACKVSEKWILRPHFGFKGSWQKEHLSIRYQSLPGIAQNTYRRTSQEIRYWGLGGESGCESVWLLSKNFRLLGNFSLSALWSGFYVEREDRYTPINGNFVNFTTFSTKNLFHTLLPVFEIFLGLAWEEKFQADQYAYRILLGWEEQIWWKMNQFYRHYEQGNHGALNMQGLTFELRVDF